MSSCAEPVAPQVIGLALDLSAQQMVLIQKNRPNWMAGCWNGTGGKLEAGESPVQAMVREHEEETGCITTESDWHLFHYEWRRGDIPALYFFTADLPGAQDRSRTVTDEKVGSFSLLSLHEFFAGQKYLYNLRFLIPMAITYLTHERNRYSPLPEQHY